MGILKDLFNGELYPFENMEFNRKSAETSLQLWKYLKDADKNIPQEGDELFSEIVREKVLIMQNSAMEQSFETGFSLGLRLAVECLVPKT